MKKAQSLVLFILLILVAQAQQMHVKVPDFNGFWEDQKFVSRELDRVATPEAKMHPEYGILPYNAPCSSCEELPDRRTMFSRFFIDSANAKHIYSQQSYFPLHYKLSPNDAWRLVDTRLMPDTGNAEVYIAKKQPVITKCDLNRKSTSIIQHGFEFESNKNLDLYFFDDSFAISKAEKGSYGNYTIGQEGLFVKNIWTGIDMQQIFSSGEIETNFIINSPLDLPINHGWMVIEDHFTLPEGYKVEEHAGSHYNNGYYSGDYVISNNKGQDVILYSKPVYVDAKAFGMHGMYKLIQDGNDYTVQTVIPVKWLKSEENTYPLLIDPTVSGVVDTGTFSTSTPQDYAGLGFTTRALGSCNYQMTDTVPGGNMLTNAYVDLEYHLTYSDSCGHPAEPAPYCTFTQVVQTVLNDWCHTSSGGLGCNPALPPFTGTCTTDPNLVHGASAIEITQPSINPNYLSCIAPQCPDYHIRFTLENQDSVCGDVCGYLCATGHMWRMTVEACGLDGSITQNKTKVCAGQTAIFTALPNCGVPPYHYVWTPDGGNTFDTIYGTPDYVVNTSDTISNPDSIYVTCYIVDSCGDLASTNTLQLNIVPSPRADAGPDVNMCLGGTATLGGNPTTNNGASTVWTASSPAALSWLSSTTSANPVVTVPPGTVDTMYYALTTTDFVCFNTDTVYVFSSRGEPVTIDSLGATKICSGASVKLKTEGGPFVSYVWNNGNSGPSITATASGAYYVIVKDSLGCMDTSNVINVTAVGPPSLHVYPDTTIEIGDSVTLYSDLNFGAVDSFTWYPLVNISCINCPNPAVAPVTDQYYGLEVYSQGCIVSDSVLIQVLLPNNFYIPNVFTPNGDGNNDLFYIYYQSGVTVLQFQVFDRWGEKVHDGLYPWDGSYRGKPAPEGVYVYVFKLQLYGHDLGIMRKGSVTLLK